MGGRYNTCSAWNRDRCTEPEEFKNVCDSEGLRRCGRLESQWRLDSRNRPFQQTPSSIIYPVHITPYGAARAS